MKTTPVRWWRDDETRYLDRTRYREAMNAAAASFRFDLSKLPPIELPPLTMIDRRDYSWRTVPSMPADLLACKEASEPWRPFDSDMPPAHVVAAAVLARIEDA